jgi:hypothetical protein
MHYRPQGTDFVTVNGTMRFNRALYGTNTGFRVEAGDLPEFALYMPGMGGNCKFGLIAGTTSKWLIQAKTIKAVYRPGAMLYEIKDPMLGNGVLHMTVLALADAEGLIVQTKFSNITKKVELVWAYGGATGKKFSRDGDIGADPESSFYLQPDYCKGNQYKTDKNTFRLFYGTGGEKQLTGLLPPGSTLRVVDAAQQNTPAELYRSDSSSATPAIAGKWTVSNGTRYWLVQNAATKLPAGYTGLQQVFDAAEAARKKLAARVVVRTPDPYINTLGGALSMAADAIWEAPTFLHGAVAWRMRLPAWRGAYAADPLGWHDRARMHFSSYALSQVTSPETGPVVFDTALHLARHIEKMGTALFSSGYICRNPNGDFRPHHYDMNLVFIDQLLHHFNWTGDTTYVRDMWPLLQRHLAWEKRNFDADNDGLYDAYCCIWASDALQYSGGAVTHSSAYNYRANAVAAELAVLIGADATPYKREAEKIEQAINNQLWIPESGWYAEYKDAAGLRLLHPSAGLWTIYHAIDSKVPDPFRAWQSLRYIDTDIPHIPVQASGWPMKDAYLLATTNWQPYTWSINNVALAENLHTALAYWQGNRSEDACRLWKSALVESMYLGASPGGFQQLSFYDANRGQLYRDFADPVGMAARTLVEGLFGVLPDALHDTLTIKPGWPASWSSAALQVPDINISFTRQQNIDRYIIKQSFRTTMQLKLQLRAMKERIVAVQVNGKPVTWNVLPGMVGEPVIEMVAGKAAQYTIDVTWYGQSPDVFTCDSMVTVGQQLTATCANAYIQSILDPQHALDDIVISNRQLQAMAAGKPGNRTFFIQLRQGDCVWWSPVSFRVNPVADIQRAVTAGGRFEKIDLTGYYNDRVTNIFKQTYLSPRPQWPTLQLPVQGIGNWCYPLVQAVIDDSGLRKAAGSSNEIVLPTGVPLATPGDSLLKNILFTSQWDNYPDSALIPLSGRASHLYILMAGSTNPMQSRLVNGDLRVRYTDGSEDTLSLSNPQNWWPIEQDYYTDGFAFTTDAPRPMRLYLKQGIFSTSWNDYITIKGYSSRAIDGGAATVLDMPLQPAKELQSITLQTLANDVVIGLMSLTLQRP